MKTLDIAWLGGLLEGEASFMDHGGSPKISLQLTDHDTLQRAANLLGQKSSAYVRQPKGKNTYKRVWSCNVFGSRAIGWMMTLYTFLGERRRGKIVEIVSKWRSSKRAPRAPRGQRFPSLCHPDRPRFGGIRYCRPCYHRDYIQRTGKTSTFYRRRKTA